LKKQLWQQTISTRIRESAALNSLQKSSARQYISVILESVKFILRLVFWVQTKVIRFMDFIVFIFHTFLNANCLLIELRLYGIILYYSPKEIN
jgi:hypothetical protein